MNQDKAPLEALRRIKVFYDLDEKSLLLLQEKTRIVTFQKDDVLCKKGEIGDRLFIIEAGEISVLKKGEDGTFQQLLDQKGGLVDAKALLEGLKTGRIGYAGLDVYEEESGYFFEDLSDRVVADDTPARLTTFNNVLVTSHQAFLTQEASVILPDDTREHTAI